MSKEITEEQVARVLLDINRLVDLGTIHAEQAQKYPLTPPGVWSRGNQKKWAEKFAGLLDMATAGNFSEALDVLHEGLKVYRDDSK